MSKSSVNNIRIITVGDYAITEERAEVQIMEHEEPCIWDGTDWDDCILT